ncbi:MAG: hypothetical protein CUN53_02690 [Phototrophicales bacterium]|nr:MAG: hypothetical protein CUN53_02690 [Phototrophicales bacterium]
MRILLITSRYLPHIGGLETVVSQLAQHFKEQHQVEIITNRLPKSLPAHEVIDGVPVTRMHFLLPRFWHLPGQGKQFLAACLLAPATLIALWRAIRRFKPDVIGLHYASNHLSAFVWAITSLVKTSFVLSLHGSDVWIEAQRSPFDRWVFRRLVARAHAVTGCSASLLQDAATLAPDIRAKGIPIHNGVQRSAFINAAPHDYPRPYIAGVGRLDHRKGFDLLIEAFAHIAPDFPDYDLLIAGGGSAQADLQAQIDHFQLAHRVKLIGVLRYPALASFYKSACVVVIPSRREPFGIVALEALAAGAHIVATRVDGLVEALADAHVTWVMPETDSLESGLREALARITTDAWRADSQHNIEASAHFGWDKVADRYHAVLEKAVHDG